MSVQLNVRIHGRSYYGNKTYATARFNKSGKLLNPRNIAKNGQVGWGPWQYGRKIPSKFGDCWWCITEGHGGYILVTQKRIEQFDNLGIEPVLSCESGSFFANARCNAYVYQFEEDCDWTVLEYFDEKVLKYSIKKNTQNKKTSNYLDEHILPILRFHYPELFKENFNYC